VIEYLNEETRTQFHLLPIDYQAEVDKMALRFHHLRCALVVTYVDIDNLEITFRIDEEFDSGVGT
jgi:hypothetical protein